MTLSGTAFWVGALVFLLTASVVVGEVSLENLSLVPSMPIERPLAAGGEEIFHLQLAANRHWLISVKQLGIDLVVEVEGPRGESLLTVDTPHGRERTESLLLTPVMIGLHRVKVRCEKRGTPEGRYRIRLEELSSATLADRMRLQAEVAVTDAGQLFAGKEQDSKKQAVAKLQEALEVWRMLVDRRREARTLFILGKLFEQLEEHRQSAASYAKALAQWRQLDDLSGTAAALDGLGIAHNYLGDNAQAIGFLEEALAIRQSLGQPQHEAETRNYLCLVRQRLGHFHSAGECYEKALSLARELGDGALEARVLSNLGGIYQNLGEPARALEYFHQALDLRRAAGNEIGEAIAANNLGAYHRRLGQVEEALLYYGSALTLFERRGNRYWQARTLNNIAVAYLALGELERARAYLFRALPLRRDMDDKLGEAVTLRNLGLTSFRLGEPGKALAFCRKALENDLATENRRGTATTRKLLGKFHVARGEFVAARVELELALGSLQQMSKRQEEAETLELLSRAHLGAGEARKAQELAGQALELYRAVRGPTGEVTALITLARVKRQLGRHGAAREYLETALEVLETLHGRLGNPSQRAAFLASQREVYELYVDSLMALHQRAPSRGHDLAALEVSERARSRSLLGLLESVDVDLGRGIEPELAERERAAERRFAAKARHQIEVLSRGDTPEGALNAEQERYAALSELDNVRAEIRRRNPRFAELKRQRTLDTEAIRELLDQDTVLLQLLLGEERSFLWWVTPASVMTYELPARETIEALARQVHEEISAVHRRSGATREALEALGHMLLGPVADRLRGQRLVVVADGALHLVPFAALISPRSRQPVLEQHEVVYLPSASVLAVQRRELASRPRAAKQAASKTVAIFADPIFDRRDSRIAGNSTEDSGEKVVELASAANRDTTRQGLDELRRLPHTRREAEAIAALVPVDQRLLITGGDARRSRVVGEELSAYRILHFASHGFIHPRAPELSGLVLSKFDAKGGELDGFLGLHDVSNLALSAELVVLSGCRTALGKQIRGEGLVGLTRGFMYAGVPRVVASFWQVRDEATAELMARFYRAMLTEDLPPAAALRAAQLALRKERRFRDPFYWAAFALQGDWR